MLKLIEIFQNPWFSSPNENKNVEIILMKDDVCICHWLAFKVQNKIAKTLRKSVPCDALAKTKHKNKENNNNNVVYIFESTETNEIHFQLYHARIGKKQIFYKICVVIRNRFSTIYIFIYSDLIGLHFLIPQRTYMRSFIFALTSFASIMVETQFVIIFNGRKN